MLKKQMNTQSPTNSPEYFRQKLRKSRDVKAVRVVDVPIYGEVGAGTIVPFTPRHGETTPIALPPNVRESDAGVLLVCGPSLEDEGIYTGDLLIFTKRFDVRSIFNGEIFIVHIIATGEILAKKIVPHGLDTVILRASGGGVRDLHFLREDIEIKGMVLGFQRMWKNRKS